MTEAVVSATLTALTRALARTRDRRSIFHMAVVVLKTNVLTHGLLIAGSIILVRHLTKTDYGMWRVLGSLTAFLQLLYVGFDAAITRFVPVESRRDADAVVWAVFTAKAALTAMVLLALIAALPALPAWLNLGPDVRPLFGRLFWLMLASAAVTPLSTTLFATASAYKLYDLVLRISVTKQATVFFCIVAVIALDLGIEHYVACELFLSTAQALYLWRASRTVTRERGGDLIAAARSDPWALLARGWHGYLRVYAVPLNVTSVLSYVRGHLPIILLGARFSLEAAAVYSILRNLITTIHKSMGSVVEGVFPRVFEMYDNDPGFVRKFYVYMNATYALRVAIASALVAGAPLIFWVYKIDRSAYLMLVLIVLVLEFLMTEVISVSNLAVLLSRRTTMLMWSATVRFVIEGVLIVLVTMRFGLLGAAIALFLSRCSETLVTIYASNRVMPLRRQYVAFAAVVALFAATLTIAVAR